MKIEYRANRSIEVEKCNIDYLTVVFRQRLVMAFMLCKAENLHIDEFNCGLDFFVPTDLPVRLPAPLGR